jgi:hypothetical protein
MMFVIILNLTFMRSQLRGHGTVLGVVTFE